MSRTGYKGLLASTALIGVMAVVSDGCSGDNGNNNGDAMSDAGVEEATHPPMRHDAGLTDDGTIGEAASDVIAIGDGGGPSDMTTGKPCTKDSDCSTAAGGGNVCSIAGYFRGGPLNPTPVCLSPTPCDLGTGVNVMFCDGTDPTDPNSPGVCLPTSTAMTGPNGQCFPRCSIPSDGSAPTGCQGKDRCNVFATGTDTTGKPTAIGYCLGGCTVDSDCPTGSVCQKDEGLCLTTPTPATKQLGQICTQNDLQPTKYGCNCFVTTMATLGYCSQFCITGPSSPAPCPSGWVCDPQLPAQVTGLNDASVTGFTEVNPGLAGYCLQACSKTPVMDAGSVPTSDAMAGDAATDAASMSGTDAQAGSMCPISAGCDTQFTAGPDCTP